MIAAALWLCVRLLVRDQRTALWLCVRLVRIDGPHLARGLR